MVADALEVRRVFGKLGLEVHKIAFEVTEATTNSVEIGLGCGVSRNMVLELGFDPLAFNGKLAGFGLTFSKLTVSFL